MRGQGGKAAGGRGAYQGPAESTPYAQQLQRRDLAQAAANAPVSNANAAGVRPTTADLVRKLKAAAELPWEEEDSGGALLFAYVERLAAENGHRSSVELLSDIHRKLGQEPSPQHGAGRGPLHSPPRFMPAAILLRL